MAYNTVAIKKDVDGKPIPQLYNEIANEYEALKGSHGASRVSLYDKDGFEVDITGLIDALVTLLTSIKNTDGIKKIVDALPAGTNKIGKVEVDGSTLPTGGSTGAKQDEIKGEIVKLYDRDKTVTLYGKSTETKPTSGRLIGDKYFEIDTAEVFMWDGSAWVEV